MTTASAIDTVPVPAMSRGVRSRSSVSTRKALPSGVEDVSRSASKSSLSFVPVTEAFSSAGPAVPGVLLVTARSRNRGARVPPVSLSTSSVSLLLYA